MVFGVLTYKGEREEKREKKSRKRVEKCRVELRVGSREWRP